MSKIDWDKLFSLHDETKELKKIKTYKLDIIKIIDSIAGYS